MSAKGKHHLRSFLASGLCDCVTLNCNRFIKARSQCCGFSSAFDKDCLALGLSVDVLGARTVL